MQLLVNAGGNSTLPDRSGKTPLHIALQRPYVDLVGVLLSGRACLFDIGPVHRKHVEWASSQLWYPDLILTDDDHYLFRGTHLDLQEEGEEDEGENEEEEDEKEEQKGDEEGRGQR